MITHPAVDTKTESNIEDMRFECIHGDDMWYFDALQKNHRSGPLIYRYLVNQAKESICVWEPYLNTGDAVLFSNISKEVDIKILTTFKVECNASGSYSYKPKFQDFLNEISIYQRACGYGLEIRFLNGKCLSKLSKKPFHDRYLFVDNKRFNVGASLTYHAIENDIDDKRVASTAIYEIVAESDKILISNKFSECWNHEYTQVIISEVGD